ncbi:NAD kinase [Acrasis kona]|uniref:NAD kinase n=1 Tax=Acrasis kona TaxID=1008807 RepID=A0AAW2YWE0_9EUKA
MPDKYTRSPRHRSSSPRSPHGKSPNFMQNTKRQWYNQRYFILGVNIVCTLFVNLIYILVIRRSHKQEPVATAQKIDDSPHLHSAIHIPYLDLRPEPDRFSNFRCVGDMNDKLKLEARSCVFNNICYDTRANTFNYYQSKPSIILFDKNVGPIRTFASGRFLALNRKLFGLEAWAPTIRITPAPKEEEVTRLKNVHVLYKHSAREFSFGHIVFEDFGNIFNSFYRLGTKMKNSVIMHKYVVPEDERFQNFEKEYRPAITSNPIVSLKPYMNSFGKRYVCFDQLQVSSPPVPFDPIATVTNQGKEDMFYQFRNAILKYHNIDPEYVPTKHKIIITDKKRSNFRKGRKRVIANLDELHLFLKSNYPDIDIEVIAWDEKTVKEQLLLTMDCTIMITPCGGVSFNLPFLPHNAHAIVMDYFSGDQPEEWRGVMANQSASMEGGYWNHFWHFKTMYYQVFDKSDWEWDFEGATNTRQDASIVIKMERIKDLIDTALEQME